MLRGKIIYISNLSIILSSKWSDHHENKAYDTTRDRNNSEEKRYESESEGLATNMSGTIFQPNWQGNFLFESTSISIIVDLKYLSSIWKYPFLIF